MENILAIESAISGGSIALLSGDAVLGKWHGKGQAARSELILQKISELLEETAVARNSITRIAVSIGPGSYTGVRIGIATAMGLSGALAIPVVGLSALRAIAAGRPESHKMVVVPLGRSGFCWQVFSEKEHQSNPAPPATGSIEALSAQISRSPHLTVIAHGDIYQTIVDRGAGPFVNFGHDVAVSVGKAPRELDEGLSPIYAGENYISNVSAG